MQDLEVDQPALRESAPGLGAELVDKQPRWDSAFGEGASASTGLPGGTQPPEAGPAGFDQPARRDSSSECGPRSSTRRPVGASLPARCSTSMPRGTEPPGPGRGDRPACTVGLSVRTLAAGDDHPARLYSASMHGVCGFDQPARRDSSSERGPRRSTIRPVGTPIKGPGRGFRPAGTAGLSLRERGSVVGSAGPAGLSLRARVL